MKMGRLPNLKAGFTLIELITAIVLIGMLTAVLSAIVVTSQRSAAIERTRSQITVENRKLVDDTMRAVKSASTVLASATVLGSNYTTGPETLVLQLPAIDSSQNLISGVSDLLVFRKNGSAYQFIQDGGAGSVRPDTSSRLYTESMGALIFSYLNSAGTSLSSGFQNAVSVEIESTLSDTIRGQTITSTLTDTATLRNK